MPESTRIGDANLLVFPNIDAAHIAYSLLKTAAGNNITIGPILLGVASPVHVLKATAAVRCIVNISS
jgi:malate dehydrogenase (oxaloacetate-decarboxylating)(NADP+)